MGWGLAHVVAGGELCLREFVGGELEGEQVDVGGQDAAELAAGGGEVVLESQGRRGSASSR